MAKGRVPMQVSPEFESRLKKLQQEIRKKDGENISLRDLTEKIIKTVNFEDLEKTILNKSFDLKVTMDRRITK